MGHRPIFSDFLSKKLSEKIHCATVRPLRPILTTLFLFNFFLATKKEKKSNFCSKNNFLNESVFSDILCIKFPCPAENFPSQGDLFESFETIFKGLSPCLDTIKILTNFFTNKNSCRGNFYF